MSKGIFDNPLPDLVVDELQLDQDELDELSAVGSKYDANKGIVCVPISERKKYMRPIFAKLQEDYDIRLVSVSDGDKVVFTGSLEEYEEWEEERRKKQDTLPEIKVEFT